jgi:hypothetical protein
MSERLTRLGRRSLLIVASLVLVGGNCDGPTPPDGPTIVLKADCGNSGRGYGPEVMGRPIVFDGSRSTTPNPPLTYSWTFGDATTGTGITPTHTYRFCNYQCSGPQCSPACLSSSNRLETGCCPMLCAPERPCAMQLFVVTLTVTDATGGSARCETSFTGTDMY